MINLTTIKDDNPRKGPSRMSKSKKCEARGRYKEQMRRQRALQALLLRPTDWEFYNVQNSDRAELIRQIFRQHIVDVHGIPEEFLYVGREATR